MSLEQKQKEIVQEKCRRGTLNPTHTHEHQEE
jgi:hypothetical protein